MMPIQVEETHYPVANESVLAQIVLYLKGAFETVFEYSDVRVDDARFVLLNAQSVRESMVAQSIPKPK